MKPVSPHLSPPELAGHAAHRLAAADVLRVSDHLAECAVCREAFARARLPPRAGAGDFLAAPSGEVPTFEELDGEITGTLTPAQHDKLAATLAGSEAAREALADLAEFRDELARLPVKFHGPVIGGGKIITPPAWRWRGTPARAAAALAALFVALAVAWWTLPRSGGDASLLRDDRGRSAALDGLPADLRESVGAVLRSGRLPPPPASGLVTERGTLAGATDAPAMRTTFPVGVVVRETRPTLRWTSHAGATGYKVVVAPVTPGGDGTMLSSPPLPAAQTRWTPPEALHRGETYVWQVTASHDGRTIDRAPKPPAGEARFEVLDADHDEALSRVEKQAADYPLVLGVAYWRAGLADAAARQFDRLARTHAQSSLAKNLARTAGETPGNSEAP